MLHKAVDDFEVTKRKGEQVLCRRAVCKPCYAAGKAAKAKVVAASHDPHSVPKPSACSGCGKGPHEVDFQWRSDVQKGGWRSSCNVCYADKGYHRAYRVRECTKDADAYLARNAKTHLEWAHRNPDKVQEQQRLSTTEPSRKLGVVRTSANARDLEFDEADAPLMEAKLSDPCEYCGYAPRPGTTLNGLDRLDSAQAYTGANTVPCCTTCNQMKLSHSVDMFISDVRSVAAHRGICRSSVGEAHADQERVRLMPSQAGQTCELRRSRTRPTTCRTRPSWSCGARRATCADAPPRWASTGWTRRSGTPWRTRGRAARTATT
jgi:hypothetical protein